MMLRDDGILFYDMKLEDVKDVEVIENDCFSEAWSEESIKNELNNPNSYFILAKYKNALIGYAGMYSVLLDGYMYNIAVKKEYRRQGVGERLINKLFEHALKNSLNFLSLEVRISNQNAIKLYKKMGFRILGVRKNFYRIPHEDALIMTKYFSKQTT